MPRTQSAKKALRQNVRRRLLNVSRKKAMKGVIKEFQTLLKTGKTEEAKKQLSLVFKKLDKLSKTGFIKKGRASRVKSRLSKKVK